jgi:hypothetical protein
MILNELKSLRWADLLLFALLEPRSLYRQINRYEPKSFALSFAMPATVAITEILTLSLLGSQTPFFYYKVTYGWILLFLCQSLAGLVSASFMDMASQFFGWKGNIREFVIMINLSLFPKVLLLPLVYLFRVFNFAPLFFYTFFSVGLFVWSALIVIQGISEMHSCNFGKAALVYLFPAILIGTMLFFVFILLVICGIGYIAI